MPAICLYFQAHQPCRLRRYRVFDIGHLHDYADDDENRRIIHKVAEKCYLPANALLLDLAGEYGSDFRWSFSISGVLLDQLERYRPEVIDGFRHLAETGCVEFLNETYYHSLAFLFSPLEFAQQVTMHRQKIQALFGQSGETFRHTELIYHNDLAGVIEAMGYKAILAEGADRILRGRSPNILYRAAGGGGLRVLLRNYRFSDDVAFRFSDRSWREYPLTVDKFAHWMHRMGERADVINVFMDYETLGEHHWAETGIFDFFRGLPGKIMEHPDFEFETPAEAARRCEAPAVLDVPDYLSWADEERDLTAWLGNAMQKDACRSLYEMEEAVYRCGDEKMLETWRLLQTSDHVYYMSTKNLADGAVHQYFNPYESPYSAYVNYMNILDDLASSLARSS